MAGSQSSPLRDLSTEGLRQLTAVYARQVLVHYGLWFSQTISVFGMEAAILAESQAMERYGPLGLKRILPHITSPCAGAADTALAGKGRDELLELVRDLAKTWVASDGCWFQAVERCHGINGAKEVNDRCWTLFAPLEARQLLGFLGLDPGSGLTTLRAALLHRLYSSINRCAGSWDTDGSLLWHMHECRVQIARTRKGLPPYACRSAGLAEYSTFARSVDSRIETECVQCPPDPISRDRYCVWRFHVAHDSS